MGWNSNRANNTRFIRSSIRHEPFWDGRRRALIQASSPNAPFAKLEMLVAERP